MMDVGEVAIALGVSKDAVRKAIRRGTMKARLVTGGSRGSGSRGNAYYIVEPSEVERYRVESLGRDFGNPVKKEGA